MLSDDFIIEVRGGAWLDEMNSCMYKIVGKLPHGFVRCIENGTGKEFALYIPYYGMKRVVGKDF